MSNLDTFKFIADARSAIRRGESSEQPLGEWLARAVVKIEEQAEQIEKLETRLARYDDARPIDEEWCLANLHDDPYRHEDKSYFEYHIDEFKGIFIECRSGRFWEVSINEEIYINHIKTIGQLNLLLDALGIGGVDSDGKGE